MGMPTQEEFEAMANDYVCPKCEWVGSVTVEQSKNAQQPGLRCMGCGNHLGFLRKSENRYKRRRPSVPPGEVDRIWEQWGNRCGYCNAPKWLLEKLGIRRDRQHIPAYKDDPDAAVVPFCEPCNGRAAIEARRMQIIEELLADGMKRGAA